MVNNTYKRSTVMFGVLNIMSANTAIFSTLICFISSYHLRVVAYLPLISLVAILTAQHSVRGRGPN